MYAHTQSACLYVSLQFKMNPCKMVSIIGWMCVIGNNPLQPDAFQLTDPSRGRYPLARDVHSALLGHLVCTVEALVVLSVSSECNGGDVTSTVWR